MNNRTTALSRAARERRIQGTTGGGWDTGEVGVLLGEELECRSGHDLCTTSWVS